MSRPSKNGGPFAAYHAAVTNPMIMKLNLRMAEEARVLHKLKHLRVQTVTTTPEWSDCCNISFEPGHYDRKVFLGLLASKLVHDGKEPLELAKSNEQLWVRTG